MPLEAASEPGRPRQALARGPEGGELLAARRLARLVGTGKMAHDETGARGGEQPRIAGKHLLLGSVEAETRHAGIDLDPPTGGRHGWPRPRRGIGPIEFRTGRMPLP